MDKINIPDPNALAAAGQEAKAETVGVAKGNLDGGAARCFALAVMAGMQIAMGAFFMTLVKSDSTLSFAASSVLGGLCFSLGLICVVVAGAELFTGNCLMVMAGLSKKTSWSKILINWVIVYVGNIVGSLLIVAIIAGCASWKLNNGAVGNTMVSVAAGKINLGWDVIVFRGIMCNILVCLAVWMGFAGKSVIDKIFTCVFPVMAFVACGFEHCVANMFFLPMGYVAKLNGYGAEVSAVDKVDIGGILYNISGATVGNLIGGAILVGCIYWIAYRKAADK